ncbi:MAG: prolyl oligopeptidase family serine peptidase [Chloroflexota bacterium]|nr:prolyl oligopeptidase family serine peptidase [Chloroflexota bacterium]
MTTSPPIRWRRIVVILLVTTLVLIVALPFAIGYALMAGLTISGCDADNDPSAYGMAREDITFRSSEFNGGYAGYYISGTRPATMIVVPTLRGGRGDRMDEIRIYHAAGYNVLTYRARTCFGAAHSLGYLEVTAVGDALAYLRRRGDIDMARVGVHGFSAGGATALMALARYDDLRTAVAHGGYHDFHDLLGSAALELGALSSIFDGGMRLAYRVATGEDITVLNPIGGVRASAPRPVLLVYGSTEVSLGGAQQMQAVDPERVRLWVVPGAGHGDYVATVGAEAYTAEVVGFLEGMFE